MTDAKYFRLFHAAAMTVSRATLGGKIPLIVLRESGVPDVTLSMNPLDTHWADALARDVASRESVQGREIEPGVATIEAHPKFGFCVVLPLA